MSNMPVVTFVVFYVSDLDESFAYFTEKLGFKSIPGQGGPVFRALTEDGEAIGFGLNVVGEDTPPAGTAELYFQADDLGELHTSLTARGAGTSPIVQLPFGSVFNVRTPDQHPVVMWHPATKF